MVSNKDAFVDYLNVMERVMNGSLTVDEAVAEVEATDGPEYAEIARESLLELIAEAEAEKGRS